ncbi:MAG TPA: 23S rRNA (guanosine(2251)-2'-O)-methyltransferase RlmB [Streptosporangiaceae bacterium]|nr:23S rRNA (guanosine(2251)-2'-O)-methyltransferase RlmB [Streptosporangiaceae bacterium]
MSGRTSRQPRPGAVGRTKSGKPRPGTGGYGKRKLEGKGPTPPASMRPGHPAQRKAAAQARAAARPGSLPAARPDDRPDDRRPADGRADDRRADDRRGDSRGADSRGVRDARGADSRGARGYVGSGRSAAGPSRGAGNAAEIVAGRNAVLESLRARVPASALHVGPRLDADERIGEAVMLAADAGIPVVEAGRAELDRMTGGAIHQGLALKVAPYSYAAPDDLVEAARDAAAQPLIVALDGITDPRNLGAIARSVAAFGGHGILVPVRRSAGVSAGAWKASAGALARVRVAQASNLAQALAAYQQAGLFVVGLDAAGGEDIGQLQLADSPLVLVVGAEGRGLSRLIAERCDAVARIPITGAESLNASVAASIALYAVSQLRH